jgi:outer membrane protein OmpA-like peptidoglycan-associated protein
MLIKKNIGTIAVFAAVIFLGLCGGNTLEAGSLTVAMSENPVRQINSLELQISNARKNQFNILAPTSFSKAEVSLDEAKKKLKRGSKPSKILDKISEGQVQLRLAEKASQRAKIVLADAIKARNLARAAGATNYEKDYAKAEQQFLKLTKEVEKNKVKQARKHQPKVIEILRKLELRAIKEQTIGEARKLIKQAEKEGAKKKAPKTYVVVQQKLNDADEFISKHRYQKVKMHAMASEALFQAERLGQITEQSKTIRTMRPEDITLWVEGILHKTASKLAAPDMRNEPLATQVDNILGSIGALQEDHRYMVAKTKSQQAEIQDMKKNYTVEVEAMREQIAALEGRTREEQAARERLAAERRAIEERLAAERRFNQLFVEVRDYFEPGEAEVYKEGNRLVIRLKAIHFPVGKHVIMPNNYSLLSKTQRAIRTFGEPDLVIEGHTDSTGSDAMNEHLSQQRAEAVRQYFVANGTLPEGKIAAVGYGSKRPLASNKTPEGRAINRRIDVIITPQAQTEYQARLK